MAINISVSRTFPGTGVSSVTTAQTNAAIPIISGTTYYVPSASPFTTAGVLVPTITVGKLRIKIYNPSSSANTLASLKIQLSDGTNTVTVEPNMTWTTAVTLSSTQWFEKMYDIIGDTAPSTTNGGAVGYLIGLASAPASGNGGITAVAVTPVLGTTNSTGIVMDLEVFGLI